MKHDFWPFLRPLLFQLDAEKARHFGMIALRLMSVFCHSDLPASHMARNSQLQKKLWGITFPNPIGLAAGLDKDAVAIPALQALGFGFVEVGTVTAKAQEGNPKPRLFRLPEEKALFNRMGFNNAGAVQMATRLEKLRKQQRLFMPLGVNIGKSKVTELEDAAKDYLFSFQHLADYADYMVVNVSSPNTPGLRQLQHGDQLEKLLNVLSSANEKRASALPLVLKLAPDLSEEDAELATQLAIEHQFKGMLISNTTLDKTLVASAPEGKGGLSGKPLFLKSTEMLKSLHHEFKEKIHFIGVGGIMSEQEMHAKFAFGADLVQIYTGLIYKGPCFVKRLLSSLLKQ